MAPRRKPEKIDLAIYKYEESSCLHAYWLTPKAARALRPEKRALRNVALFYEDTAWGWLIATALTSFALGGLCYSVPSDQ